MNNDNMDKLKHEHGITDEHGDHKDKHQEHHAGHDHSGHDHSGHNHSGQSGHDHSGHGGHAHHHHGSFKELFLKSLPLGIIIMLLVPLHGFELPFQFTFPYSDIVVAILSTILIVYGGRPFYQGAVDEFKQKKTWNDGTRFFRYKCFIFIQYLCCDHYLRNGWTRDGLFL